MGGPIRLEDCGFTGDLTTLVGNNIFDPFNMFTGSLKMAPCNKTVHIKHTVTPQYYSCYTVSIDSVTYGNYSVNNKWIVGVDVVLFLNNQLDDVDIPYEKHAFHGQASGARIS